MNKILIIEDEQTIMGALANKFSREGFSIITAMDGEEGLRKAVEELPDMIILDIVMPKMDGMEMLEKLRGNEKGRNIPVFVLTNLDSEANVKKSEKMGVFDYAIKSNIRIDEIVEKIKRFFEKK